MEAEKLRVLREHKASLVFSLGNGFQVRNLLVSCRPSRYSKPTRLLTGACSPRMASSVTLRAVQCIQISLLFTRNTCRFGKYLISFSTELHYHVCTNDPTQHFDWTGCRRIWSKHRTTGDILLVVESSSRQEPTRSNKVKGCETIACKHMNSRHSATYRCDLCMAQTLRLLLHQTQKKTVDCGPATFRQNVCSW